MIRFATAAPALALFVSVFVGGPAPARGDVEQEVERLTTDLGHDREHKRLQAIESLGRLGENSAPALPQLMKILHSGPPSAQVFAARAVPRIAPKNTRVFDALVSVLSDTERHYEVRRAATLGLERMAKRDNALRARAIPIMAKELRYQKHGNLVDVALADGLGRFGSLAFSAGADLEHALLESPFDDVKTSSFAAMARVSEPDPELRMAELIADIRTGSLAKKARAFGQLRGMGKGGTGAVGALLASCDSERPVYERIAAMDTLSAVAPASPGAIGFFAGAVRSDHYLLKPAGAEALGMLDRIHLETALEPLLVELQKSHGDAKREILMALRRVGPREEAVVDAVVEALVALTAKEPAPVIYELLEAVRSGAPQTQVAAPRLVELIDPASSVYTGRPDIEVESLIGHALVSLADIGVPEGGAAAVLKEFARANRYVLPAAIRAVGALGPAGAPAVPKLIELLESGPIYTPILPFLHDTSPVVEAIRALGRIGPAAKDGIKVLEAIANQKQTETSETSALEARAARKALSQIRG